MNPTPEPAQLTAERVESKLLVRPEYAVISKTMKTLEGSREICYPCALLFVSGPVKFSEEIWRGHNQILFDKWIQYTLHAPISWTQGRKTQVLAYIWWYEAADQDSTTRLWWALKTVCILFLTGLDLNRRCIDRESLMHMCVFTHFNMMTAAKSLRLKCPEQFLPTPSPRNTSLSEHGLVVNADQELKTVEEWL